MPNGMKIYSILYIASSGTMNIRNSPAKIAVASMRDWTMLPYGIDLYPYATVTSFAMALVTAVLTSMQCKLSSSLLLVVFCVCCIFLGCGTKKKKVSDNGCFKVCTVLLTESFSMSASERLNKRVRCKTVILTLTFNVPGK